jgi:hypothetical protein
MRRVLVNDVGASLEVYRGGCDAAPNVDVVLRISFDEGEANPYARRANPPHDLPPPKKVETAWQCDRVERMRLDRIEIANQVMTVRE